MTTFKTIGLVVTASGVDAETKDKILMVLQEVWSCSVRFDEDNILGRHTSEQRAQCLLQHMQDSAVDLIWIVRGGEGSSDILPYLHQSQELISKITPKPILGISDATAVLIYLHQCYQWCATYSLGALMLAKPDQYDKQCADRICEFVQGTCRETIIEDLQPLNSAAMEQQLIEARVCVGNLSLLAISIKDLWEFDANDRILIVEDWHERGYVVDRTMKYFMRIGKLTHIKALIFGDMLAGRFSGDGVEQRHQEVYMEKVLKRLAAQLNVPVFSTRHVGHGFYQVPVSMGPLAQLQCGLVPSLSQYVD